MEWNNISSVLAVRYGPLNVQSSAYSGFCEGHIFIPLSSPWKFTRKCRLFFSGIFSLEVHDLTVQYTVCKLIIKTPTSLCRNVRMPAPLQRLNTWLRLLTYDLKNLFSNSHSYINICVKFHWNPSTKYRDIASREIGVNGQPTDGRAYRRNTQTYTGWAS